MQNPENVWVVDDDRSIRWVLEKALSQAGLSVECFDNGETLLQHLDYKQPDVIVSDIRMPGLDGLETTSRLSEAEILAGRVPPPVVGVTANALPEQIEQYKAAGMVDVLAKPVAKAALLRTIATVTAPDADVSAQRRAAG